MLPEGGTVNANYVQAIGDRAAGIAGAAKPVITHNANTAASKSLRMIKVYRGGC